MAQVLASVMASRAALSSPVSLSSSFSLPLPLTTTPAQNVIRVARRVPAVSATLRFREDRRSHAESSRQREMGPSGAGTGAMGAALAAACSAVAAQPAVALEPQDIVDTLEKAEKLATQTGQFVSKAYEVTASGVETLLRVSKPLVEAAAPVVKGAVESAIEAASPVVADATSRAAALLEEQGVDLEPVIKASQTANEVTSKVVTEAAAYSDKAGKALAFAAPAVQFLASQNPQILAAEGAALLLLWFAFPALVDSVVLSIRGYAGTVTPAQTMDLIITKGDYTIVDVRTEEEKEAGGVPSMPRGSKNRLLSVPVEEIPESLRGQLKNARALEGELTAIKIASYKKLRKGSKVIVLDSKGDIAKAVARSLTSLGFRNTFVVQDGVDGATGWANSALALDFYEAKAEFLSPSSILSAAISGTSKETKEEPSSSSSSAGGTLQVKLPSLRPRPAALLLPGGKGAEDDE